MQKIEKKIWDVFLLDFWSIKASLEKMAWLYGTKNELQRQDYRGFIECPKSNTVTFEGNLKLFFGEFSRAMVNTCISVHMRLFWGEKKAGGAHYNQGRISTSVGQHSDKCEFFLGIFTGFNGGHVTFRECRGQHFQGSLSQMHGVISGVSLELI